MIIKFSEINTSLGTRNLGSGIREQVISELQAKYDEPIVFDFQDVEIISHSFADECFGKLVELVGLDFTKNHTTFKNANSMVSMVIKQAIQERMRSANCM